MFVMSRKINKSFDMYNKTIEVMRKDVGKFCVKYPTEGIYVKYVSTRPSFLVRVKYQTERICLAAVRNDGMTLRYVKHQTNQICLAAVKQYWFALQFVDYQTVEMCQEAIKKSSKAYDYVKIDLWGGSNSSLNHSVSSFFGSVFGTFWN